MNTENESTASKLARAKQYMLARGIGVYNPDWKYSRATKSLELVAVKRQNGGASPHWVTVTRIPARKP